MKHTRENSFSLRKFDPRGVTSPLKFLSIFNFQNNCNNVYIKLNDTINIKIVSSNAIENRI